MRTGASLGAIVFLLSVAPLLSGQVVGGVMTVTGAEMH